MKPFSTLTPLISLAALLAGVVTTARAQTEGQLPQITAGPYDAGPDSKPQPGVPKGEVLHFTIENSKVFPGTFRDYWVYVPAQYQPGEKACLYVNQDGIQWNAPTVFDNLIARKEMPVTIGVFVMHGRVRAANGKTALDRFNRSYEYDGLGDNYVRFLLDELLPEVETKKTADGRAIHFSHDGNDHAIGGSSSGAIAAFTAAWERPDAFSRVFSVIGTYVGLRGGHNYPTLIRKTEPKPLRVFLQDGANDLNIYGGDWWMANQSMARALRFAGYEVDHVYGTLGHNGQQGAQVFPSVMRWLWKDWPAPVKTGQTQNGMIASLLHPGENWNTVTTGLPTEGRQAPGPDGRVFVAVPDKDQIVVRDTNGGKSQTWAKGIHGSDIVVAHNGNAYVAESAARGDKPGRLWLIRPDGKKSEVGGPDAGEMPRSPAGVTLSPDQTLLYVADGLSHWVYSYQIQPDGTLRYGQKYYWLHAPDDADDSGARGMCVDVEGRLYVATRMGIQVCDQAGRVNAILPTPNNRAATGVAFGGGKSDTLVVTTSGDRVYTRRLNTTGANAWATPLRPAPPGL